MFPSSFVSSSSSHQHPSPAFYTTAAMAGPGDGEVDMVIDVEAGDDSAGGPVDGGEAEEEDDLSSRGKGSKRPAPPAANDSSSTNKRVSLCTVPVDDPATLVSILTDWEGRPPPLTHDSTTSPTVALLRHSFHPPG